MSQNAEDDNENGKDDIVTLKELHKQFGLMDCEKIMNGVNNSWCTYAEGYLTRQAVLCCLTCKGVEGSEKAGICYACSENCHSGHEIIHLYTKRKFCCDCGNSRFGGDFKCTLFENRLDKNRRNKYNHNYDNLYCVCNKTFPLDETDPKSSSDMVQCLYCEDWFHPSCINLDDDNDLSSLHQEMVCFNCAEAHPWLHVYKNLYDGQYDSSESGKLSEEGAAKELDKSNGEGESGTSGEGKTVHESEKPIEQRTDSGSEESSEKETPQAKSGGCVLRENQTSYWKKEDPPKSFVMSSTDWRKLLCKCEDCMKMYEDLDCEFLLDENDPVLSLVTRNQDIVEKNQEDELQTFFNQQGPGVMQMVQNSMNMLGGHLKEFLTECEKRESNEAITPDDVEKYFDGVFAKRRRMNDDEPEGSV